MILDAGTDYRATAARRRSPAATPRTSSLRVDRADGFVGRNFLTRGAQEHGFYNEEVDGILLDRMKFFWGADYGHLSFTSDHNVVENCEGFGAGDAVVYPGAAPETGSQATDFYPDAPRANTVITDCDLHGSALGYSGSMGNAVRITHNHIYGNTTGISSDTLSAAGHPGFPADSSEIDHNYIYSNNLDLYTDDPPVDPLVASADRDRDPLRRHERRPASTTTGSSTTGATARCCSPSRTRSPTAAAPRATSSPGSRARARPPTGSRPHAATSSSATTSAGRRTASASRMRSTCSATCTPTTTRGRRSRTATTSGGASRSRPTPGTAGSTTPGSDGTAASVTGPGEAGRLPGDPPQVLPSDCATSVGNDDLAKLAYLIDCGNGPDEDTGPTDCDWWTPAAPAGQPRRQQSAALSRARAAQAFERRPRPRR